MSLFLFFKPSAAAGGQEARPNPLSKLNGEEVASLAEAARAVKVENPIPAEQLDRMDSEGTLTSEDMDLLAKLAAKARTEHRGLHQQEREGNTRGADALADIHLFLNRYEKAQQAGEQRLYQESLHALAPGTPADSPVAAALFAGLDESEDAMKVIAPVVNQLADGSSPLWQKGNQVDLLFRGDIWKTKIGMLEEAIARARSGQPPEIDVQYYELSNSGMLDKLIEAAQAGCPLRVSMDPGRLQKETDARSLDASDIPRKMRSLIRLVSEGKGKNVAITLYPVDRQLKNPENVMNRRLFRVGDTVLLGGVNAGHNSPENIDSAMRVRGPAAAQLIELYRKDMETAAQSSITDIYGAKQLTTLQSANAVIGPSGLVALWQNLKFLTDKTWPQQPQTSQDLAEMARLVHLEDRNGDQAADHADLRAFLADGKHLQLTQAGADLMLKMMQTGVNAANSPDNLEKVRAISTPEASVQGAQTVALGSSEEEREALLLHAVGSAEKFLYLPSFALTRAVAAAVAERKRELGDRLDVRVIGDTRMGNDLGMRAMEDAGVQTRWTLLMGKSRKLREKAIITDKLMLTGSTDPTRATHWELSGALQFEPQDPQRDRAVADFLRTWEEESIDLNSRAIAEKRDTQPSRDREVRVEEARYGVARDIIRGVEAYERASGEVLTRLADATPGVREQAEQLAAAGLPPGYALQEALREKVGVERLQQELRSLPAYRDLERLREGERVYPRDDRYLIEQ